MSEPRAMTGRVTLGNGEVRDLALSRQAARIIDVAIIGTVAIFLAIVGFAGLIFGIRNRRRSFGGDGLLRRLGVLLSSSISCSCMSRP